MPRAFGALIVSLMDKFQASSATIAGVLSMAQCCRFMLSPVAGVAIHRYGCRPSVFVGGLLASVGVIVGAYCTSLVALYATYGALTGCGHCLINMSGNIMIGTYFEKRRAIATALVNAGFTLAGVVLPPIFRWLLAEFGVSGTLLIVGGISLNACAGSLVMRPLTTSATRPQPEDIQVKTISDGSLAIGDESSTPVSKKLATSRAEFIQWLGLDFSLLVNLPFLAFTVGHGITNSALVASWAFIPLLAISKGIDESRAALLLSAHALFDLFLSSLFSAALDAPIIRQKRYLASPIINLVFCAVMAGLFWSRTETGCFFWTCLYGSFNGTYVTLRALMVQDLFGRERLASSFAFSNFFGGVGSLLMPIVVGVITDASGVESAMIFLVAAFLLGATLFGVVAVRMWRNNAVI